MRKIIKSILLILPLSLPSTTFACYDAIDAKIGMEPKHLINSTNIIVLAKVTKKEIQGNIKELVINHFETIEVLKGKESTTIASTQYANWFGLNHYTDNSSFNNHTDKIFWKNYIGRVGYPNAACQRPIPKFVIGNTYLIFNGSTDSKAYEVIENKEIDKWYKFVKTYISKK